MGKFVEKLTVSIKGARAVRREPSVAENIATHGEAMAERVNSALRMMGNNYVRVHVVASGDKTRARSRVLITYPASEHLGNLLINSVR